MSEASLEWAAGAFGALKTEMSKALVGQEGLVEALSLALVCGQHVLIEGVPGVAKTLAVRTLSKILGLDFQRIQFTPDLLPSDLVGTQIYNPQTGNFSVRKGPVFANLVLADEINRAPAKVQSALLESMEERQVTLGDESFPLPRPFMVLATQNPIEQEGTYPLPEAQLDRFMFKIEVGYPDRAGELEVLRLKKDAERELFTVLSRDDLERLRTLAAEVHLDPSVEEYIVDIVRATREPSQYKIDLTNSIRWGAGPRAVVFFLQASRARAIWKGRAFVMPEDVKAVAPLILRHRLLLSYEALAEGLTPDAAVARILEGVKAP
jgi:MoxR-like ATPase